MAIRGPKLLDSEQAKISVGRTFYFLKCAIRDDLIASKSDKDPDRPALGYAICLATLLKEHKEASSFCHPDDAIAWRDSYLEWFDKSSSKIKLTAAAKAKFRKSAVDVWNQIAKLSDGFQTLEEIEED